MKSLIPYLFLMLTLLSCGRGKPKLERGKWVNYSTLEKEEKKEKEEKEIWKVLSKPKEKKVEKLKISKINSPLMPPPKEDILEERSPKVVEAILFALQDKVAKEDINPSHLEQIQSLYLSVKNYSPLPKDLEGMKNLRSLYLAKNSISKLPKDYFKSLHSLKNLDLHNNQLEDIDHLLESLSSLPTEGLKDLVLNLNGNNLNLEKNKSQGWSRLLAFAKSRGLKKIFVNEKVFKAPFTITQSDFLQESALGEHKYIHSNSKAFQLRHQLLRAATESIDINIYGARYDIFTTSLLGRLIVMAERGLAIRMLIDASEAGALARSLAGKKALAHLSHYENVQIKIFNSSKAATPALERSSNRDNFLIIDNSLLLVGTRKWSKEYFIDREDFDQAVLSEDWFTQSKTLSHQAKLAFEKEFTSPLASKNLEGEKQTPIRAKLIRNLMAMEERLQLEKIKSSDMEKWKTLANFSEIKELVNYPSLFMGGFFQEQNIKSDLVSARAQSWDSLSKVHAEKRTSLFPRLVELIRGAKKSIQISTSHLFFQKDLERELIEAGHRGVKITFLTHNPKNAVDSHLRPFYQERWIEILNSIPQSEIYTPNDSQSLKMSSFIIDSTWSLVGNSHFDKLSDESNSEFLLLVQSPKLARQMNRVFTQLTSTEVLSKKVAKKWKNTKGKSRAPASLLNEVYRVE